MFRKLLIVILISVILLSCSGKTESITISEGSNHNNDFYPSKIGENVEDVYYELK